MTRRTTATPLPVIQDASESPNIVTIGFGCRDPKAVKSAPASKAFYKDGRKISRHPQYLVAIQVETKDIQSFARVFLLISNHPNLVLVNTRFPGEPVFCYEQLKSFGFTQSLVKQLGFFIAPKDQKERLRGEGIRAYARTRESTLPTSYLYDDFDVYDHTPENFREMSIDERLSWLEKYIPGICAAPKLITPSSSARVVKSGMAINSSRRHIWFRICGSDHEFLAKAGRQVRQRMIADGDCWVGPIKNGSRESIYIPADLGTPWAGNSVVYAGKPSVEKSSGLSVLDLADLVKVVNVTGPPVDLSNIPATPTEQFTNAYRKLRPHTRIEASTVERNGHFDIFDLRIDLQIEVERGQEFSLQQMHDRLLERRESGEPNPKIRCQSPLRPESQSMAAFVGLNRSNEIFLYDSGIPGETYWLARNPDIDFAEMLENAPKVQPELRHNDQPLRLIQPFPGVMNAVVKEALDTAPIPQPNMTVLGTLIAMAAACPGKYYLPNGLRLNLYGLFVSPTGSGKDHIRKIAMQLAQSAGALVIGKPASGQGLEDALSSDEPMLIEIDEAAHLLAQTNSTHTPTYLIELASVLLKLFSAGSSTYNTRRKAKASGTIPARAIRNVCVSLLGFATPEKLGKHLLGDNITDGLLGRMLFVMGDPTARGRLDYLAFSLPSSAEGIGKNISSYFLMFGDADVRIEYGPGVEEELKRIHALCDDQRLSANLSNYERALRARSFEKILRICGVLAVWSNPDAPVISKSMLDWATEVVEYSNQSVLKFIESHMHAGVVQANAAHVLDMINRIISGSFISDKSSESAVIAQGYAPHSLVLKRSKLAADDLARAIRHLESGDQIENRGFSSTTNVKTKGVGYRPIP